MIVQIFRISAIVMGSFGAGVWLLAKEPIADKGGLIFLLCCLIYISAGTLARES
jgi:hypothetical protein